ncbi:MAG: hypothetical protein ACLTUN_03440 [Paraclostridium sordellii]|uniref:hypothetical protein n=1 Tax=Paraclostridium sordellii TaxID=1505 RepID=UPI001C6147DE|nr:hypothetical protein [Paeniclostridium sordellii]QYE96415.1 hypothetical protein KZ987_09080 [Paeniclostridium sordellii]
MDYYKCSCPSSMKNFSKMVELKFDERPDGDDVLVSIDPKKPTIMLEVFFNVLNPGDIIWLNGVVVLDYEYEPDTEDGEEGREAENANITIVIQKISYMLENPKPIYTLEVDLMPGSDDISIPFSHVEVETSRLEGVIFRVVVYAETESEEDVDIEGPNTLTAIRFSK